MSAAAAAAAANAASATLPTGDLGNKVKGGLWILVAVLVIVLVIIAIKQGSKIFAGINAAMDSAFGLFGFGSEDRNADANLAGVDPFANTTTSPFNPMFYKSAPGGTGLLLSSKAASLAAQIYDSVGAFYDDPEAGFSAFKQCRNWAQVSQLCDMFNIKYSKDAYSWLKIKYDTTAQKDVLAKIVNYCKALPKYS